MATRGIDPNTFVYYPPNYSEDIQRNKGYVFLGSFSHRPTLEDCPPESLRALVIKTNFGAKKTLYKLEKVEIFQKPTLGWYHWKVIQVTIQTLCSELWKNLKTALFFLVGIPLAFFFFQFKCDNPITDLLSIALLLIQGFYFKHLFHVIREAQGEYIDPYFAFQHLSKIPNFMEGFNPKHLVNAKTTAGWLDRITLEPIPASQISSNKTLRIGREAFSLIPALKAIFTRSMKCQKGEIPHPFLQGTLTPDEKEKFLREVSAFFAIANPADLEACWSVQANQEIDSLISKETLHLNRLPPFIRENIHHRIIELNLPTFRKMAFLKLLPDSIAREYFDDQFRSLTIEMPQIPTEQEILAEIEEMLFPIYFYTAAWLYQQHQRPA